MAQYNITPEFQDIPLPFPEPLALLLKGAGMMSGKGGGGGQKQANDKRKFLPMQGLEQKQDERLWDAKFDIEVNNLVDEAMQQQKQGGMSAKDYLSVGPGAKKFNAFLSEYYLNMDMLSMRSQTLQENKRYYDDFVKTQLPKIGENELLDFNDGTNLLTKGALFGDNTRKDAEQFATVGDYITWMNTVPASMAQLGSMGNLARWSAPEYDKYNTSLSKAMTEATGSISADLSTVTIARYKDKSGKDLIDPGTGMPIIASIPIGDNGTAAITYHKKFWMNGQPMGAANESALTSAYLLWKDNMTPEEQRVYNKKLTTYTLARIGQLENQMGPQDNPEKLRAAIANEFDMNQMVKAINMKLEKTTTDQTWEDPTSLFKPAPTTPINAQTIFATRDALNAITQGRSIQSNMTLKSKRINPETGKEEEWFDPNHAMTIWNPGSWGEKTIRTMVGLEAEPQDGKDLSFTQNSDGSIKSYDVSNVKKKSNVQNVAFDNAAILINPDQLNNPDINAQAINVDISQLRNTKVVGVSTKVIETTDVSPGRLPSTQMITDPSTNTEVSAYPSEMYFAVTVEIPRVDAKNIGLTRKNMGEEREYFLDGRKLSPHEYNSFALDVMGVEVRKTSVPYDENINITDLGEAERKAYGIVKQEDNYYATFLVKQNPMNMMNLTDLYGSNYNMQKSQAAMDTYYGTYGGVPNNSGVNTVLKKSQKESPQSP